MLMASHNGLMSFAQAPLILFIILLLPTHIIYHQLFRRRLPVAATAGMVQALAIYARDFLYQVHLPPLFAMMVGIEVFIIWAYIACRMLQAYFDEQLSLRFSAWPAMGTWVAATVITASLLDQIEKTQHGFIALLALFSVMLYLVYLVFMSKWCVVYFRNNCRMPVNGAVLLVTVSIQAAVILMAQLFYADMRLFYQVLISAGMVFYIFGLGAIIRYNAVARARHLLAVWPNNNCIIHGAISITGAAMLSSQVFSMQMVKMMWWCAVAAFCIVEVIELCRLCLRIRLKGVIGAVMAYDVSQWARMFTFGMFYAFALAYYNSTGRPDLPASWVVHAGLPVLTVFWLLQLFIVVSNCLKERKT